MSNLTMAASRELDAIVAVQAMGLQVTTPDPDDWFDTPMLIIDGETDWSLDYEIPYFTTFIDAAERVLMKLIADGWHLTFGNERDGSGWWVVGDHDSCPGIIEVDGETLPLTICRAALMARELLPAPSTAPTTEAT